MPTAFSIRRSNRILCLISALAIGGQAIAAGPALRRARKPDFPKTVEEVFFLDAREKLVGTRPAVAAPGHEKASSPATPAASPSGSSSPETWSKLIAAEIVEDEIKSLQVQLAKATENATRFKGGQYQEARTELGGMAAMLAIVAEFDGSIRWKREAAALRDQVGRAGVNCRVASDAVFTEVRSRSDDLLSLVRGGSLDLPPAGEEVNWPLIADRPSLMKRLEKAQQQVIAPLLSNEREFKKDPESLLHESQIIAALAEVISREGYEFSDDENYLKYARDMQQKALELRDATLQGNYEQARQAGGALGQSCTNCHEGYRS